MVNIGDLAGSELLRSYEASYDFLPLLTAI